MKTIKNIDFYKKNSRFSRKKTWFVTFQAGSLHLQILNELLKQKRKSSSDLD